MPALAWNRRWNDGELPRGYLSNDYGTYHSGLPTPGFIKSFPGGMDAYVRAFHPGGTHDLFYTDQAIIDAYKKYVAHVVARYAKSPVVLGWELGNDLRCASTLPASSNCKPETITKWAADICKR